MTLAGSDKRFEIEEAIVKIRLGGGAAQTEIELLFRNDEKRMVEGEFVLPLPAGATVSSYALEVNGELREAVAVEKERARNAYESIKRQMIDPGIVEREAGNVYRTRVFPVPAKGTKRLRIGYVETLPVNGENFLYHVPLKFDGVMAKFSCEIEGGGDVMPKLRGAVPLTFSIDSTTKRIISEAKSVLLNGGLELRLPLPTKPEVLVDNGDETTFLLSDIFPEISDMERPAVRRVGIFWDASESGAGLDHTAMFDLLDAWFLEKGEVTVDLKWLRDRVENAGVYEISAGDWRELRKRIEEVDYEGATSLDGLKIEDGQADLAIYCGDGVATLGRSVGVLKCPLLVLHHGDSELAASLRNLAEQGGGAEVNVGRLPVDEALKKLNTLAYRVIDVSGSGITDVRVDGEIAPGKPVSVSGRLSQESGTIEIAYGIGSEVRVRREVRYSSGAKGGDMVRRLWAQRRLAELEDVSEQNVEEIVEHCRQYGLVSDATSLIVLERFEDHVRYEIPPPEPSLRKRYDRRIAQARVSEKDGLLGAWKRRLAWFERSFPGREYVLMPRYRQVEIWKRSVERVFHPGELDARAFATVAGWNDRVRALIERRSTLPDVEAYEKWLEDVEILEEVGKELAGTPVEPPPEGKPLVVSVRGHVSVPGQVRTAGEMTLRASIAEAGGALFGQGLDRVALYRNSGKTVYNTLSKEFEDISLRPGDMVVLEDDSHESCWDPFVSGPPSSALDSPAVVGQQDVWVEDGSGSEDSIAGNGRQSEAGTIQVVDPAEAGMPDLAEFEARLMAGDDARAAYQDAKGERLRPARFYVEAARRLFASGHDELAMRVLSALVERGNGSGASRRAFAFWLMEFEKLKEADRILSNILPEKGGCPVTFPRAELAENDPQAVARLDAAISGADSNGLSLIALTELNRLESVDHPRARDLRANLPCDLRITVIADFFDVVPDVEIIEPTGTNVRGMHTSATGGILTKADGVAEYMIHQAVPGVYSVRISSKVDSTFRISLHTNWGRENQKTVRVTRLIEADRKKTVAELEFDFVPSRQ